MKITFGQRFKELRTEKGLTQEELARDFTFKCKEKISKAAISQYEHSKRTPEVPLLKLLADYFGVTVDFLLGSDEEYGLSPAQNYSKTIIREDSAVLDETNDDDLKRTIGKRLGYARKRKAMTLRDVGSSVGVVFATIGGIERGESFPSIELLNALCKIYGVDSSWVMGHKIAESNDGTEDLQLLFKQVKGLSPQNIKKIMRIIEVIGDEGNKGTF